jgi:hypothetical protein
MVSHEAGKNKYLNWLKLNKFSLNTPQKYNLQNAEKEKEKFLIARP